MAQSILWPCGQSPPPRLEEHVGSLTPGKETVGDRLLLLHWLDAALYVGLCLFVGGSITQYPERGTEQAQHGRTTPDLDWWGPRAHG